MMGCPYPLWLELCRCYAESLDTQTEGAGTMNTTHRPMVTDPRYAHLGYRRGGDEWTARRLLAVRMTDWGMPHWACRLVYGKSSR